MDTPRCQCIGMPKYPRTREEGKAFAAEFHRRAGIGGMLSQGMRAMLLAARVTLDSRRPAFLRR
jgi:hypothetical protein